MARPPSSCGKNRPGIAPLFNPAVLAAALGLAPASGAQAQQGDAVQLPAVTVNAAPVDDTLIHLDRPVNGGALGSRTQLETPFSTTVVTAADMEARQVAKLGDVFALDASVSDNS